MIPFVSIGSDVTKDGIHESLVAKHFRLIIHAPMNLSVLDVRHLAVFINFGNV